jgi:molybdate transport system substrate-binding protein
MKTTVDALAPAFERASGRKLIASYAPSAQIARRIAAGEAADVAIVTGPGIEALVRDGRIIPGSRADIALSAIGVAVRVGAPRPDISSVAAFVAALLAAKSIAMSNPVGGGASGAHMWSIFERLGIAEQLKPRTIFGPGGPAGLIGFYLLRGEAEIGLQQIPELMAVPGIEVVGAVPGEMQLVSVFTAGICTGSADNVAARALIDFLRSAEAAAVIESKGMLPA